MFSIKQKTNFKLLVAIMVLVIGTIAYSVAFACDHNETISVPAYPATCIATGCIEVKCMDCGNVLEEREIPVISHAFGEELVLSKPSANKDGEAIRFCVACGYENSYPIICRHKNLADEITKEATCVDFGIRTITCVDCGTTWEEEFDKSAHIETIMTLRDATCTEEGCERVYCDFCEVVIDERPTAKIEHSYDKWFNTKVATPTVDGVREKSCIFCGHTVSESYSASIPYNGIYIEGTGVSGSLIVTGLSQSTVDAYDMVYDTDFLGTRGAWILGHNYGTLSHLSETKVGSIIYVSINGNIRTYRVIVSEFAMQNNSWTDIICQSSGYSIFHDFGEDSLRMYTCYGGTNGRWVVFAEAC